MIGILAFATTAIIAWLSFGTARRFVRMRLRYVEAALRPSAAVIAGVGATLLAWPVVSIAHLVPVLHWVIGASTALVVGASVGLGVHSGASDVKRGYVIGAGD